MSGPLGFLLPCLKKGREVTQMKRQMWSYNTHEQERGRERLFFSLGNDENSSLTGGRVFPLLFAHSTDFLPTSSSPYKGFGGGFENWKCCEASLTLTGKALRASPPIPRNARQKLIPGISQVMGEIIFRDFHPSPLPLSSNPLAKAFLEWET